MYLSKTDTLEYLLGTRARSRLIRALFRQRSDRPWLRDLGREVRAGWSGLYRELEVLRRMGLIRRKREGGACFFIVDMTHPLAEPLRALIEAADSTDFLLWWEQDLHDDHWA